MIKNVLNDIGGVGLYGVISVCLFFAVFLGALVSALRHQPSFVKKMSALPLEDGETSAPTKGEIRHD